jgi:hypothetical protein
MAVEISMIKHACALLTLIVMAIVAGGAIPVEAASKYGCFKVTSDNLNIRDRPYSTAATIGNAVKGEILEKRKLWCTPRGYWCAIRQGLLEGYADKNFMQKVPCPN